MSMKDGWVYLLRERDFLTGTTDRYLKIGLTERDVEDRVKEHQTGNARQVISVYERHVPLMSAMETYLHHVFSTDRINGEWFDMDDDRVNNEVIPLIEALADQQVVAKADKERAAEVKKIYDNGKVRDPTPHETALHADYVEAKHAHVRAKALHAIDNARVRALIGSAQSIDGVVSITAKPQGDQFDKASFLASLTEVQRAQCYETVTQFSAGSVKVVGVKTLKTLDPQLDADKKAAEAAIATPLSLANVGGAELARTSDAEAAHMAYLASRRAVKEAEWDEERLAAALLVALGEDREITGVISCVREDVTTENKWSAALAKQHFPDAYAAHTKPRDDTFEVKINDGHPY